jgi:CRP-like cAMP-binding protein
MDRMSLSLGQILYEAHQPIPSVYFPESGLASLVHRGDRAIPIEIAMVGSEGLVGLPLSLGVPTSPHECYVQVPGEALRMSANQFQSHVLPGSALDRLVRRYAQAQMAGIGTNAACNCWHPLPQRLARWLLEVQDRVRIDSFPLRQVFLSQMLAVHRQRVSVVASQLRREALIRYSRGWMTVLDRQGLEARACRCYWVRREEFARVLS